MSFAVRRAGGPVLAAGLAILAFVSLAAWGASPVARYLDHDRQPGALGGQAAAIVIYLAGWLLMIMAMMLPTTVGLMGAFERVTRARPHPARLRLELLAGFVGVWLAVGYGFRAVDLLVHRAVDASGWLSTRPRLVAAGSFALAGAFQFAPLKHRCLSACRTPRAFILRGWSGSHPQVDALRIGVDYGRSCAACCWALMLIMFGVGAASLPWMLALGAVMAAERFAPERARRRLGTLIGATLLAVAATLAVVAW